METPTRLDGGSITTQIIEQQIAQLRYTGLFLALTGHISHELNRIHAFYDVLMLCLKVSRTYELEPKPDKIPVVYNVTSWTSEHLCGYAGSDIEITSDDLATSYVECWLHELQFPRKAVAHFQKCALWYSEKRGRDPLAGLSFLLDLFEYGFFVKWDIFKDVLNGYLYFHAFGIDFSFMDQTTIAEVGLINKKLEQITREYEKVDLDTERFEVLIASVGDLTIDRIQKARDAQTLDEWLISQASVSGPVWWLAQMHYASVATGFGVLTRQMLSYMEEIGADLQAAAAFRNIQAENELPPVWGLASFVDIAKGYRERYSDDSWLDRMTEDRLLFPDCVRDQIRPAGLEAFTSPTMLTRAWGFPSERLAFSLCLAHRRHPSFVRSADFEPKLIYDAMKTMGLPLDKYESKIAARRRLLEMTDVALVDEIRSLETSWAEALHLHELRALYPWHPLLCLRDGILHVLRRDLGKAINAFQSCLMIEPDGAANWLAMAGLAERKQFPHDAAALNEIAKLVANISEANR